MGYLFILLMIWLITATARIALDYKTAAARLRVSLYPTVLGIILWRKKEAHIKKTKKGQDRVSYSITTQYRYFWQGKEHQGDTIAPLLKQVGSPDQAADLFEQLTEQRRVKVYVNPQLPTESYLSPGPSVFSWRYVLAALILGYALPLSVLYFAIQSELAHELATSLTIIK